MNDSHHVEADEHGKARSYVAVITGGSDGICDESSDESAFAEQ